MPPDAARYDKCVDAEIEWLRIKYEQQREKAIEQALEQGLMLRGDNADEDMNSTVLDDDATTEAGFLQGIASQSKFHRGMDDESTFSSESEGGSCSTHCKIDRFVACLPAADAQPYRTTFTNLVLRLVGWWVGGLLLKILLAWQILRVEEVGPGKRPALQRM